MPIRSETDLALKGWLLERLGHLRLSKLRLDLSQNGRSCFDVVLSSHKEDILEEAEMLVFWHQVKLELLTDVIRLRLNRD